jgi:DNA mismatch repair protein MutS
MAKNWKSLGDVSERELTPMLRQYLAAKAESGDSLLFFRMGDFYELFFEDAIEASELLGLTLTSRDGSNKEARIPMAGVPVRAVDGYLAKAIQAGRTVTICDQVEDPRQAKGVVQRAVTRTVTPGTVLEPDLLDAASNNFLAAVTFSGDSAGLALADVSTGELLAAQLNDAPGQALAEELMRMGPVEVVYPEGMEQRALEALRARFELMRFTERPRDDFDAKYARELLLDHFGLNTLKGLELESAPEATACAGAILAYLRATQRDGMPHLRPPRRYNPSSFVVIDGNTQRNLELVESLRDKSRRGTLIATLDRTRTSMGGRKLRHWILHPLLDVEPIRARLEGVDALFGDTGLRLRLAEALKGVADLERLLGRLTSRTGNARDVKGLGDSLAKVPDIRNAIAECGAPLLREVYDNMDELRDVAQTIADAIVDEPPIPLNEGRIIKGGYDAELDRIRDLVRGGRDWIAGLQRQEIERTGIPNLKVGYNKVFGYYIEVSKAHTAKVPETYQRKQTLVNAERYITPELKSREEEIVNAQERMNDLEYELFCNLRDDICRQAGRIQATADAVATLDALLSLADTAAARNYCKPALDDSDRILVRDGRHPVVEDLMPQGKFVPNDTVLDPAEAFLQIVTGPNMAGKSTYLRQVALITLMAQMGSFVPAAEAQIGVVDRIFTRVGASDNLVRGESTFMVEMIESAAILNSATERSLIVLDEIGRGTSTFDGISIAWSVAEYIHDNIRAKTLFATHYHELTELANKMDRIKNLNVAVREWSGKVIFLYRIVDGGADHSYGIQVAKLAGLPKEVTERAHEILAALESGSTAHIGLPQQMQLFVPASAAPKPSEVEKELRRVNPDELSPREAQELLYHLKQLAGEGEE